MSEFVMPSYTVFLDTNTMYSKRPDQPISKSSAKTLEECGKLADVLFFAPSVVPNELAYQQYRTASVARDNLLKNQLTITSAVGVSLPDPPPIETLKQQAIQIVESALLASAISIYEIPTESIDWHKVINDACWRANTFEPPPDEQPEWEKGFRDRMVLEASITGLIEHGTNRRLVFISGDNKLRDAFNARCSADHIDVELLERPSDLLSHIKLLRESKSDKFAKHVFAGISRYFYDPTNADCVFNHFKLKDRLIELYGADARKPSLFSNFTKAGRSNVSTPYSLVGLLANSGLGSPTWNTNPPLNGWRFASGLRIKIGSTEFRQSAATDKYTWLTKIQMACMLFYPQSGPAYPPTGEARIRIVNVNVNWKCHITLSDGTMANPEIESIDRDFASPFIEADLESKWKFELPLLPLFALNEDDQAWDMADRIVGEERIDSTIST